MSVEVRVAGTLFPSRQLQRAEAHRVQVLDNHRAWIRSAIQQLLNHADQARRASRWTCEECKKPIECGDLVFVRGKWTCDECLPH